MVAKKQTTSCSSPHWLGKGKLISENQIIQPAIIFQMLSREEDATINFSSELLDFITDEELPLGTFGFSKMDVFLEKFRTAFDPPPPHFRKLHCAFFLRKFVNMR